MTRDEAFDKLEAIGAAFIQVSYHGGGDEGFVGDLVLLDAREEPVDAPVPMDAFLEVELQETLEQPIYDDPGHGFGDDECQGEITWDVAEREVLMTHSYPEWVKEQKQL